MNNQGDTALGRAERHALVTRFRTKKAAKASRSLHCKIRSNSGVEHLDGMLAARDGDTDESHVAPERMERIGPKFPQ